MLLVVFVVAGCSPGQPKQLAPSESFQELVSEFRDRAAKKSTNGLNITVTEQFATDQNPTTSTGTIQLKKQLATELPRSLGKTVAIIDLYFVHETNRWRCTKAMSKDLEGDKVTGQNSLEGPDIRLGNLLIWAGM